MKNLGYMLSFLMIGVTMPIAIWVAAVVAIFSDKKPTRRAEEPIYQV